MTVSKFEHCESMTNVHLVLDVENRLEDAQDQLDDEALTETIKPEETEDIDDNAMDASFMSESIYEKLPSANSTPTRPKRHKTVRRKSMPILHEHFEPGSMIREIPAHNDMITSLDFDVPFG